MHTDINIGGRREPMTTMTEIIKDEQAQRSKLGKAAALSVRTVADRHSGQSSVEPKSFLDEAEAEGTSRSLARSALLEMIDDGGAALSDEGLLAFPVRNSSGVDGES